MLRLLKGGALQTKLKINQPGDQFEQEADRAADAVMRMPDRRSKHESINAFISKPTLQRACDCGGTCTDCQEHGRPIRRSASVPAGAPTAPAIVHDVLRSPGQPLDTATLSFMEPRFGADFSSVRVHTDTAAAESACAVNALAYTVGNNIIFASHLYSPQTHSGRKLLAHELAHTIQQGDPERHRPDLRSGSDCSKLTPSHGLRLTRSALHMVQRTVRLSVLDWDARKLHMPVPVNSDDGNSIVVPPKPDHILVSGLVQADGDAADNCAGWEIGTTQAAWIAWEIQYYSGRHPHDGSVTISRRHTLPIRDPGPDGDVWYDRGNVRSPAACGDSAGTFHVDGPWEWIPKAVTNNAAGGATNYLRGYTRGLHLVTYLTARDPAGNFLKSPLRFVYWNSLHDFRFTPNFDHLADMWAFAGQVRINIGAKGRGATADAPYFTTTGPTYGQEFNDPANLVRRESP